MADKKTKVIFHIVNSIKGGSGKSTISFLLAAHYNEKEKNEAVIIDLDVNGSSWNYDHKIDNPYDYFLQDYMYKPEIIESSEGMNLKYKRNNEEKILSVVLSDPKRNFRMSDCEIDLFENTIYNV